jgi:CubicO group peptidase (beta-lactamase class C family)
MRTLPLILASALLGGCAGPQGMDATIVDIMEADHIPGLATCAIGAEGVLWCKGYGFADIASERDVTKDTPFLLASVSKTITATGLAVAAERGLVDLDASVGPTVGFDVRHPEAQNATISARMLASHTSGIRDNWDVMDESYTDGADSPIELGDFMEDYLASSGAHYDADQNFVGDGPLDRAVYSNVAAALGALVLEEAAGQPFDAWCDDELFGPLGMEDTAWFIADMDRSTLAVPYEWWRGEFDRVGHYGFPDYPSGQLRASARDTAVFVHAVMTAADGPVSAESRTELLRVQYPELDEDQGLGWYRWRLDGQQVWGHNGGESGASTEVLWDPEAELGVVVLMNAEGRGATLEKVERAVLKAAAEE